MLWRSVDLILARALRVTETSRQISLKSAVPTSAKSAYVSSGCYLELIRVKSMFPVA